MPKELMKTAVAAIEMERLAWQKYERVHPDDHHDKERQLDAAWQATRAAFEAEQIWRDAASITIPLRSAPHGL